MDKFRLLLPLMMGLLIYMLTGCSMHKEDKAKIRDLEFTVVSEDRLSDELKQIIEERKAEPFKLTYSDKEYLYICIGYGEQDTGGYSIAVNELYLTENAVYVDTNLLGPSQKDEGKTGPSYPYIVLKTELLDKSVVFE